MAKSLAQQMESQRRNDNDRSRQSDRLSEGDTCPKDECQKCVIVRRFPRTPRLNTRRHEDHNKREVICSHHGIVQKE